MLSFIFWSLPRIDGSLNPTVTHRFEPVVRADRIVKMQTELNAVATAKARLFWDYFAGTKQAPNFRFCCLTETIVQMSCLREKTGAIKVCGLFRRLVVGAV